MDSKICETKQVFRLSYTPLPIVNELLKKGFILLSVFYGSYGRPSFVLGNIGTPISRREWFSLLKEAEEESGVNFDVIYRDYELIPEQPLLN